MPKLKTNSGAKKRFKFSKSGKVKRKRAQLRHILTSKGKAQKRRLSTSTIVKDEDMLKLRKLMPYS
ncbi:MAG: 50S ribosomal protein L35 [Deltaproteobacteria bacterium CG11_big_fil_rev_8_21_14_0_20_49_13]|nr:MAG: 50S ribosomal protein L35 [Deltaproteobacteria bacterium CG11_big_fil_rev_8_21_14_0_20_49_13]